MKLSEPTARRWFQHCFGADFNLQFQCFLFLFCSRLQISPFVWSLAEKEIDDEILCFITFCHSVTQKWFMNGLKTKEKLRKIFSRIQSFVNFSIYVCWSLQHVSKNLFKMEFDSNYLYQEFLLLLALKNAGENVKQLMSSTRWRFIRLY